MKINKSITSGILCLIGMLLLFNSCRKRDISDDAILATYSKNGEVFIDGFSAGLEYLPFADSYFEAFSVDEDTKYEGTASMRFDVPNEGNTNGSYAGAIFPDNGIRDLSDFDALTFWAKSTTAATINDIGFGQDFDENKYEVSVSGLELTTNWKEYTIPIPDPSKLTAERGLFWYAEGPENNNGYSFWIDELEFKNLGTIAQPRPAIMNGEDITTETFAGTNTPVTGLQQTFNLADGSDQTVNITPAYFEFTSSNPGVATVNESGVATAVSEGTAVITATLGGIEAAGQLTIVVSGGFNTAPTPTQDPSNVISIFSDAYNNIPVDYYNGFWAPYQTTFGGNNTVINGDNLISYTSLNFVGIQFAVDVPTVDASAMTHFHIDVMAREDVQSGDYLVVRLVDAGADNTLGTGDDTSGEITLSDANLSNGEWYSLDVPLSDLVGLTGISNLAQVIFVSDETITSVFIDNIYLYGGGGAGATMPTTPAPTPAQDAADVISIYSDTYTDVAGSDFNPNWGQTTAVSEVPVSGNNTLFYEGLNYQGFQIGTPQDVSDMDYLHLDYWTDNSTELNVYLISGNATEVPKSLAVPTSGWVSIDIPLGDFSPVDLMDIIQLKFDGNGDIYLDNIYFYKESGGGSEPNSPAPTPTQAEADVISLYSGAYTNVAGSDINPNWGQTTVVSEVPISGNNTLFYEGLNYQGFQIGTPQDVSDMGYLHLDYWTNNSTALNVFLISGNTIETPKALAVPTSGWVSIDIPLGDFSPVDLTDIIQYKFDGNGDIYLDNIYFYKESSTTGEPSLPLDFEDGFNPVIPFDGGATAAVINNTVGGTNTSSKILQFNKVVGSAWYSGVVFDDELRTTPLIDLSNGTIFTVKMWSPTAGVNVRLQLEGGAAPAYEAFQTIPTANEWVTLTFDFTSQVNTADTYPKFALFPDFDFGNQVPVSVEAIYYIDDISQ